MPRGLGMTNFENKCKYFEEFGDMCIDQVEYTNKTNDDIQNKIDMVEAFQIVEKQMIEKAKKMFWSGSYNNCSEVKIVSSYENSRLRLLRKLKAKRDKKK